jgi:hypothetical protein
VEPSAQSFHPEFDSPNARWRSLKAIEPLQPESAMRQSKKEDKGHKAINDKNQTSKPRKRVIRPRMGIDGKTESIVAVMDHAPVHPMFLKAPLFTSIKQGTENVGTHVESYYTTPQYRVDCRFEGPQALCIRDQSVLLALCQLGARADQRTLLERDHPDWPHISASLHASGQRASSAVVALKISAAQIAKTIGLNDSGTNSRSVEASLRRLSSVTMHRTVTGRVEKLIGDFTGQSKVIGYTPMPANKGLVVLCAELSDRCTDCTGVTWVNMAETRVLRSPPAKRLHAFLSAWASTSEMKCIGLDKLPAHIYGRADCEPGARKSRRIAVRAAISEVAALPGWWCEVIERTRQLKVRKPIFAGTRTIAAVEPSNAAIALPFSAICHPGFSREPSNDVAFQGFANGL